MEIMQMLPREIVCPLAIKHGCNACGLVRTNKGEGQVDACNTKRVLPLAPVAVDLIDNRQFC